MFNRPHILNKLTRKKIWTTGLGLALIAVLAFPGYLLARPDDATRKNTNSWLIKDGYVMTMDGQLGNLDGGDVLVERGKITRIGQHISAPKGVQTIDAKGTIVMPGLIDNHRHAWEGIVRGQAAGATFGQYFQQVLLGSGAKTTPRDNYLGTRLSSYEALNAGVTTLLDWDNAAKTREHAKAGVDAMRDAGIRGVYAYGPPSSNTSGPHPVTQEDIDALYKYIGKQSSLMSMAIATNSPELRPGTEDRFWTDVDRARALNLPITIHIAGFAPSRVPSTVQLLHDQGLLKNDMTFVHANFLTEQDFKLIAEAGAFVSSSPEVELQMGSIPSPIAKLRAAGVTSTVSVDVPTAISGDLFDQLRILLQTGRNTQQNSATPRPPQLDLFASDVLPYATINAAKSLKMEDKIGSLVPGKQADLIMVRRDSMATFLAKPAEQLVQYASPDDVDTVLVAGRIVKRAGMLVGIQDLAKLQREATAANKRLLEN